MLDGAHTAGVRDALVPIEARPATRAELETVHPPGYLDALEGFCLHGGGHLDADTTACEASWSAALRAAGAGLDAAERLRNGEGDAAFVVVRPPGHHAVQRRAMGFCLVNNVAVMAATLAEAGERVMIVDYDAHHGNGTQEIFWDDPRVTYVSLHEWPQYPGTGARSDVGAGPARGKTVNIPVPSGTTGDRYLQAFDEIVVPLAERVKPTWLIVSAGYDGHVADPLCDLALSAGDYGEMTSRLTRLVPTGRLIAVLEGGYDLDALTNCAGATVAALAGAGTGACRPEPLTSGGAGRAEVELASRMHASSQLAAS